MQLEIISRIPQSSSHTAPLLFVHGAWHGAWCWDEFFLPYFARHGYAAYALSLRGHGASEGRETLRWASLAGYVDDVAQVAQQLTQPPIVIGHSMGGLVIQKYLEQHPAPAAVLLASLPPHGALPFFLRFFLKHPIVFLKVSATLAPYHMTGTPALAQGNFFSADLPYDRVQHYFARLQDESLRAALDFSLLNLPYPKRVDVPMLVLGAGRDSLFTMGEVALTAQAYSADATIFPRMAHDMMLEPNWQAVADRMLEWFVDRGF